MKIKQKKAIIIGAGIGGIATAIRLIAKGFSVEVFEANNYPGGKLSNFTQSGYRFDAGPSLFTLPSLVEELFELSGKKTIDYFEYETLSEVCRYFWDDKTTLTASANTLEFATSVEKTFGEPKENILKFLRDSAFKYNILDKLFLQNSLHKVNTWFSKNAWNGYKNLHKLGLFQTMNQANEATFKHPKLVQLFNRYATYNGSDPYQTPATLNIIPHLEYNIGAFFPKKGMVSITEALIKLAKDLGVKFHLNTKVVEISVDKGFANGILTKTKISENVFHAADLVVSNMDITPTYRKLLPTQIHPERLLNQPKSSSGLIFYWGIKKTFNQLGLHNILFSKNYKKEFKAIFQENRVDIDPTVYINISSKHKTDDAPLGCENWFVLINVPANSGQDWDKIIAETRENIINKISKILGEDISQLIECESILDPRSIESRTSSAQGALYGNSSNNKYAAFLRHANFSSKIKNLYFVGGSVHPGGGIPLALSSGKIMSEMVK